MPEVEDTDSGVLRIGVTRKPPEWLTLPEKAQGAETRTRKTTTSWINKSTKTTEDQKGATWKDQRKTRRECVTKT